MSGNKALAEAAVELARQLLALELRNDTLELRNDTLEVQLAAYRDAYEEEVHVAAHLGAAIFDLTGRFPDMDAVRRKVSDCLAIRDAEAVVAEAHSRIRHPATRDGAG